MARSSLGWCLREKTARPYRPSLTVALYAQRTINNANFIPRDQGNPQNFVTSAHCLVPWSLRLDLPARPATANLLSPPLQLQTAWIWYKQYQKAKEKGCTNLTTASSIHKETLTTHSKGTWCGYTHPYKNALVMVRNVIFVMAQAISPAYIGNPKDNLELPRTAESDPIFTQRGIRSATANTDRADHPAESDKPTRVSAEAHP